IGMEQDLEQNAKYVGVNKYTATVKVSAPQITSCISANAAEISINVLKRPLTVKWTDPEDNVYDGNTKYITAELLNTLENDYIGLSNSQYSQISASTYTYSARLSGFNSNNYYIAEGETHTFTILPRPVALTWDEQTEFEYDGEEHSPTAYAFDLSGGKLGISYYGARTEAGENYTVTATITDSNYVVDESSADTVNFKIKPKQVDVTWGNTELTYNGQIQAPTARAVGVSSVLVKLSVTGEQIDANLFGDEKTSTYTAVAASADSNYTVNPETASVEFTIVQRTVTVMVGGITIEYGESFKYEYVVDYVEEGIIAGDDVKVNLSVDYTPDENGNIPVGEYDIIVKLSGEDSKYYILNVERQGKLTVIAPEQEEEE
ncbi:MAG: hypothetical protein K2L88_06155, partial [Clostridiales bacterium]|nr:hypothetical protein [Clostridiales bacterium]